MDKVPGTPGIPGGGVVLGQPKPPQRTKTTIQFHSCAGGFYAVLDENDVCAGYKLQIVDPIFNRVYEFDFGQDLYDSWIKDLAQFPRVGEKVQGENNGTQPE